MRYMQLGAGKRISNSVHTARTHTSSEESIRSWFWVSGAKKLTQPWRRSYGAPGLSAKPAVAMGVRVAMAVMALIRCVHEWRSRNSNRGVRVHVMCPTVVDDAVW